MIFDRHYTVFVELTHDGTTYRWATDDQLFEGNWYEGKLIDFPAPSQAFRDEFGITRVDKAMLSVVDDGISALTSNAAMGTEVQITVLLQTAEQEDGLEGESLLDENGDEILTESGEQILVLDGSATSTPRWFRTMFLRGWTRKKGQVDFQLEDFDASRLDKVFPTAKYSTDDWPDLFQDDDKRTVPYPVGVNLKLQCAELDAGATSAPYRFGVCQEPNVPHPEVEVLTVYRDGRVVDSAEYSVHLDQSPADYDLVVIEFDKPQTDFDNSRYTLKADIQNAKRINAVHELQRVLRFAGFSTDTESFDDAASYYAANIEAYSDIPYVDQRQVRGVIQDLLMQVRGHLYQRGDGTVAIVQDKAKSSVLTLDEDACDPVELESVTQGRLPKTVELDYRPAIRDPRNTLRQTVTRDTGGAEGVERYKSYYIRDHTVADKTVDYLAKRVQYGDTAKARVFDHIFQLGDRVTIASSLFYSGEKDWTVRGITQIPGGQRLDLREYDSTVYNYASEPLPSDATQGYNADFSKTPPEAPSNFSVDATGTHTNDNGQQRAWIEISADLPAQNAEHIEFLVQNNGTGEQFHQKGQQGSGGTWSIRFEGLEPGADHSAYAWAVNSYGVEGVAA